ncbi:MAG TPA: hypothetical protein VEA59_02325 [Patescibacteria group bacterium]|nr:hypothetical protein [Patescibacteria group bacterium]
MDQTFGIVADCIGYLFGKFGFGALFMLIGAVIFGFNLVLHASDQINNRRVKNEIWEPLGFGLLLIGLGVFGNSVILILLAIFIIEVFLKFMGWLGDIAKSSMS